MSAAKQLRKETAHAYVCMYVCMCLSKPASIINKKLHKRKQAKFCNKNNVNINNNNNNNEQKKIRKRH